MTSSDKVSCNTFAEVTASLTFAAYNITIKDFSLPVINVSTKDNPSYLPAEVCIVRPGQPAVTKLYPAQTQQMIRFAVRRPARNAQSIVTTGNRLLGLEQANPTLVSTRLNLNASETDMCTECLWYQHRIQADNCLG